MFWPRGDTKVLPRRPRYSRTRRWRNQPDAKARRLVVMCPLALTTGARVSEPLVLFNLPSRIEHTKRAKRKRIKAVRMRYWHGLRLRPPELRVPFARRRRKVRMP